MYIINVVSHKWLARARVMALRDKHSVIDVTKDVAEWHNLNMDNEYILLKKSQKEARDFIKHILTYRPHKTLDIPVFDISIDDN